MTVQSLVGRLARLVDPYTKDQVEILDNNVGTVAGDRFTAQRLLDVYNEARFTLFFELEKALPNEKLTKVLSGLVKFANLTFVPSGGASSAADKPSDCVKWVSLMDSTLKQIVILPPQLISVTGDGLNPQYQQDITHRAVFDIGTQFVSVGTAGTVYLDPAAVYQLLYMGLSTWTLADVTGGTVQEKINPQLHGTLLEIAELIANEQGATEIGAVIRKIIGGG